MSLVLLAAAVILPGAAVADAGTPSTPLLSLAKAEQTSLTISWQASVGPQKIIGYRLSLDGSLFGWTTSLQKTFAGLTCGTTHTVQVDAVDSASTFSGKGELSASTAPCATTGPASGAPSIPALILKKAEKTSLTISWQAPVGPQKIIGYRLYLDGSLFGWTTALEKIFAGLTCGTTHTVHVEAVDSAAVFSGKGALSASTMTCAGTVNPPPPVLGPVPPPQTEKPTPAPTTPPQTGKPNTPKPGPGGDGGSGANLYVAVKGSDKGKCTQAAPCGSFDRAYRVARPGQAVQVAGGAYPGQSLRADSSKASAAANVVFRPAGGATVTVVGLSVAAAHVEFRGLGMDLSRCVNAGIAPPCPSLSIKSGAHDVVIDDMRASRFYITGAYNIRIQNSDFGPSYDFHGIIHADTAGNRPHDIVLSNVSVHDHWNTDACKTTPGCLAQHHQGCGPTLNDAYNVLEDRMRFFNCQNLGQLIKPYKFANENITIQNSWFGASQGFYSLDLTSKTSAPNKGLHIRNNTFTKGIAVSRGISYPNSDLTGNTLPSLSCSVFLNAGWRLAGNVVGSAGACSY